MTDTDHRERKLLGGEPRFVAPDHARWDPDMNPTGYTTHEAADIIGANYRKLDNWKRTGTVVPSIAHGHGSGNVHRYSDDDLLVLMLVHWLRAFGDPIPGCGLPLAACKAAVHLLRENPHTVRFLVVERPMAVPGSAT